MYSPFAFLFGMHSSIASNYVTSNKKKFNSDISNHHLKV